MDLKPLVSIGLPTCNRPTSLSLTIESLITQTYQNIEIIISDNCSIGDETDKIVKYYLKKDKRIQYFKQEMNKGAAFNFQFVLGQSTADYFMWLADDDWLDKNFIEYCVDFLQKNPDYSMAGGIVKYYNNNEFLLSDVIIPLEQDSKIKRFINYYGKVSNNGMFYSLIRKPIIEGIKIENILGFDWLLIGFLAFQGKIKTFHNIFLHRNITGVGDEAYYKRIIELSNVKRFKKVHIKHPHIFIGINIIKFFLKNKKMSINITNKIIMLSYVFTLLIIKWELSRLFSFRLIKRVYGWIMPF